MEADFSGYATKAGLKCSDGRTIMPEAFKHQDTLQVPLVWQHCHSDPENVLGHAILEAREDGIYAYGFFNASKKALHMKEAVDHKDIRMMSIWANELVERAGRVLHGAIREVSLVLNGANPGAVIENITIRHSDEESTDLDDEALIYTGLQLELRHSDESGEENTDEDSEEDTDEDSEEDSEEDTDEDSEEDSEEDTDSDEITHAGTDQETSDEEETVADIYDTMSEKQKDVLHYMLGEALNVTESDTKTEENLQQDNTKGAEMGRKNVFEKTEESEEAHVLSHSDIAGIVSEATTMGSLKKAVEGYALAHGITDIEMLFPEVAATSDTPEWFGRRTDWVDKILTGVRKSPFNRIKTLMADITEDEARAKGYITGNMKKAEFFSVSKRVTVPTTIYKKQQLDRDDMIDITDFDVVAWLKGEMRLMLDEELARAILIGDGRDPASDDKINDQCIRPISSDHELYTTAVNVNIDNANSSVQEIIDSIVMNRRYLRGTGLPTLYTTETYIARFLLLKDTLGRRIYMNLEELASELRVAEVVSVEVMEEEENLIAVLVNPIDYVIGATKGGEVGMFDDFDIDYNRYKYLIETRCSGALTKLKAAMVVRKVAANLVLVVPTAPTFNGDAVTIPTQVGVVYRNTATNATMTTAASPYAVADGVTLSVHAIPAAGYYFESSEVDSWNFTGR